MTQLEHACQTAHLAVLAGAGDAPVVAALLHDVGWLLPGADDPADNRSGIPRLAPEARKANRAFVDVIAAFGLTHERIGWVDIDVVALAGAPRRPELADPVTSAH